MITKEQITQLIEPEIVGTDIFLVDVKVGEGNKIHVIADADGGLSIDKCVKVSRAVEFNLDREVEDFELQVTSPGLSNPLQVTRQYIKNVGRGLKVRTADGEEFDGELTQADEQGIVLEKEVKRKIEGTKKKEKVKEQYKLNYDQIKEAKVMISFK